MVRVDVKELMQSGQKSWLDEGIFEGRSDRHFSSPFLTTDDNADLTFAATYLFNVLGW